MTRRNTSTRSSAAERGYDARWQAASAAFRSENPFCLGCEAVGLIVDATCVDHVVPHGGDEALFWNMANWQASCSFHHLSIKPRLEREWRMGKINDAALRLDSREAMALTKERHRPAIGPDGYPIEGT
jgi:5-methylcytosine-specific restriction enzyme A